MVEQNFSSNYRFAAAAMKFTQHAQSITKELPYLHPGYSNKRCENTRKNQNTSYTTAYIHIQKIYIYIFCFAFKMISSLKPKKKYNGLMPIIIYSNKKLFLVFILMYEAIQLRPAKYCRNLLN